MPASYLFNRNRGFTDEDRGPHCKADHYHTVILTDDDIDYSNGSYVLMGLGSEDVYINSHEVAEYAQVDLSKGKKRTELKTLNVQTYLP